MRRTVSAWLAVGVGIIIVALAVLLAFLQSR